MRLFFATTFILLFQLHTIGQSVTELLTAIQKAQQQLHRVSYTLQRTDTLVTGHTRSFQGRTIIQMDQQDSVLGFLFWSKRDDVDRETLYDGRIGYEVEHPKKTYRITQGKMLVPQLTGTPGGQVLFLNLVKIDTSGAVRMDASADASFYYLTLYYPDIKEYDVLHRYTRLFIDKKRMLPVRMRSHQETLGKVQDLYYEVKDIAINEAARSYDFFAKPFLADYSQSIHTPSKALLGLKDKAAPPFELISFTDQKVSSSQFTGKVVLLDFWEVWCSPCIASMPKVQALQEKYKNKGLLVYGISCENDQLESAKKLVAKRGIDIPMLAGTEQVKHAYSVLAVPLYLLIDKQGIIRFVSEGYTEEIEVAIQKALAE